MTVAPVSPRSSRFAQSAPVPISHLTPQSDAPSPRHIRAVVALVWPYSISTRALSLLLAEPDVRLRKGKGQVKVTFRGPSAEAVAQGRVGIGDTVQLGLEGAQWVQSSEQVSTPGKKIEWDLVFDGRANLDVKRDSQIVAIIEVDCHVQAPAPADQPRTGHPESSLDATGPHQQPLLRDTDAWSSPAFVKGKRLSSGSFFHASLDPFADDDDDDDGFVVGKGRKRTKFARHSDSWQLVDRTPSPEKAPVGRHLGHVNGLSETAALRSESQPADRDVRAINDQPMDLSCFDSRPGHISIAGDGIQPPSQSPAPQRAEIVPPVPDAAKSLHSPFSGQGRMEPPRTPSRRAPYVSDMAMDFQGRNNVQSLALSDLETPRLAPVPSPGLPLVSPLIRRTGLSLGYFPDLSESCSELEMSGEQSLPGVEGSVALSNEPTPSPTEVSLLSPTQAEKPRGQEIEPTDQDNLFELNSPHQRLSPQPDQPVQLIPWPSDEAVRQPRIMDSGQEQDLAHADAFHSGFLNTSPMEAGTDTQNMWHFIEPSTGPVVTSETHKHAGPVERPEAPELRADISEVVRNAVPVDDDRSATVLRGLSKPDTSVLDIGGATQDGNVDDISDIPPGSPSKVPMNPSLMTGLEEATDFVSSSQIDAQIPTELPGQGSGSRPWSSDTGMSIIGDKSSGVCAAPPFPFEQRKRGEPSGQLERRSSQFAPFDGMSDEISGDESSEAEVVSESSHRLERLDNNRLSVDDLAFGQNAQDLYLASSPTPPARPGYRKTEEPDKNVDFMELYSPRGSQNVIILDSSDEGSTSGEQIKHVMEDAISGPAVGHADDASDLKASEADDGRTETRVSASNVRAECVEDPALLPLPAHGKLPSPAIDTSAASERERSRTEDAEKNHRDLSGETVESPTETADFARPLEERLAQRLNDQLATPENTQQQEGEEQLQGHVVDIGREMRLPTPQSTQEYANLSQPTVELPIPTVADVTTSPTSNMPLPTSVDKTRERRRSSRLSQKFSPSHDVTKVVSPYFAPRRTSQMRTQGQLETLSKPAVGGPSPAAINDATEMAEEGSALNDEVLSNKEAALASPLSGQLSAGLTTPLSYYTPLALLQDHFSRKVDILAISTTKSTEPQKAKSDPRDWHTTLHLTENSFQGNQTTTAQVFRPNKTALPKLQRGNIVLLRNFKVQSQGRKCMLLSTETSAWTVFDVRLERGGDASNIYAVTVGPPVEYGAEEKAYILALKKWWNTEGEGRHPVQRQASQSSKAVRVTSKGDGGIVTHGLRDGKVYHDRTDSSKKAGVSAPSHELRDGTVYGDDTQGKVLDSELKRGEADDHPRTDAGTLHALRDGTVYQDGTPTRASKSRRKTGDTGTTSGLTHDDKVATDKISPPRYENRDATQELEPLDVEEQAETDSDEKSPATDTFSSPTYHELRNGRRYTDPTPDQKHTEELGKEEGT